MWICEYASLEVDLRICSHLQVEYANTSHLNHIREYTSFDKYKSFDTDLQICRISQVEYVNKTHLMWTYKFVLIHHAIKTSTMS